jgi:pilus assembly protein CpaF
MAITEVVGLESEQVVMQDIFAFKQSGIGPDGRILGEMKATGAIPTWLDSVRGSGIAVDMGMFSP